MLNMIDKMQPLLITAWTIVTIVGIGKHMINGKSYKDLLCYLGVMCIIGGFIISPLNCAKLGSKVIKSASSIVDIVDFGGK
jgi:hypothetical protein